MATTRQKAAARKNIKKARSAKSGRARGQHVVAKRSTGLSTQKRNQMGRETFAFPKERKEPLNDAGHVRNAIARFDQVEGVSDAERDAAWRRIRTAARKYGVEIHARGWRSLTKGGKSGPRRGTTGGNSNGRFDRVDPALAAPGWRRPLGAGPPHPLDRAHHRARPLGAGVLHPRSGRKSL